MVNDASREMGILYSELFEAAGVGRRLGESMAAQEGQTQGHWQTMWVIEAAPLTVPQIARRLGVTRQNTQRVAAELERDGLVEFAPNPDHKTSPLVQLTAQGRDTLNRLNENAADWHADMLKTFTIDDVATLRALLQKFVAVNKESLEQPDRGARPTKTARRSVSR